MGRRLLSIVRQTPRFLLDFLTILTGLPSGTNGEQAKARAAQGFDMISIATDVDVISLGFAAHMASATGANATGSGSGYST